MMKSYWLTLLLLGIFGCSTPNLNVQARRLPDGRVEVKGPLAGPFDTSEGLAGHACGLMTRQPGASGGMQGVEYCALYYFSRAGGGYFLSHLSNIRSRLDTTIKSCVVPAVLDDKENLDAVVLGPAHTHPHNREFSANDLSMRNHVRTTRVAERGTGQVWDRGLMMFFQEKTGECSAYKYDYATRLVLALRSGEWVSIGRVYNDAGDIELLDGRGWLP